ncbi:MAG: hypothetical protein IKV90_08755 [Clostridia bacterium]|nr:hypothetical protein [Clostridia bacterium]
MRMPFQGKIERAQNLQREQKMQREHGTSMRDELSPSDLMEKGDGCAMVIAAMITIIPVALITVVALAAIGYFFIMR